MNIFKKLVLILTAVFLAGCDTISSSFLSDSHENTDPPLVQVPQDQPAETPAASGSVSDSAAFSYEGVPAWNGSPFAYINGNEPFFTDQEKGETDSFLSFSGLDALGRCQTAFANLDQAMMPEKEREPIGMIRPSGWHTVRYDDLIEDKYLYNRCHLIGYQLCGENANEKNLITGTRYLNIEGMLPIEDDIAWYLKESGNHCLYRVTPVFIDDEMVARGVLIEAYSIEDHGTGMKMCAFCYNVQPGINIDYKTGDSARAETSPIQSETPSAYTYVVNKKSGKFHRPDCKAINDISEKNKLYSTESREELIAEGYEPCGLCQP